jgi:hypothetical protein
MIAFYVGKEISMSIAIAQPEPQKLPQTSAEFAALSVEDLACLTFGNPEAGKAFLQLPHHRVDGMVLADAAKTVDGNAKVRSLLLDILFTMPA